MSFLFDDYPLKNISSEDIFDLSFIKENINKNFDSLQNVSVSEDYNKKVDTSLSTMIQKFGNLLNDVNSMQLLNEKKYASNSHFSELTDGYEQRAAFYKQIAFETRKIFIQTVCFFFFFIIFFYL